MRSALLPLLVAGALLGFGAGEAHAITTAVGLAAEDAALGEPVDITISISGLGAQTAPSLGSFDITVAFSAAILTFQAATFGDPALGDQLDLSGLGSITETTPSGAGSVNVFELSLDEAATLDALQAADFRLATLSFVAVGIGSTPVDLTIEALSDAHGVLLDTDLLGGTVRVTRQVAVAEPSSLIVFGLATAATLAFSRRRPRSRHRS